MIFAEKLKNERKKKGWSQEELAEKLFVSRQSVSKWENGQNYPSIEIIIKVSDLFGVTIDSQDNILKLSSGLRPATKPGSSFADLHGRNPFRSNNRSTTSASIRRAPMGA
ncbi:Xre family transcriptional regulator [Paenibacillus naphthalenovorans]|uniref:Xre family transcriptional regulator n=1 Tax=Paenibacillus naphthalenovorans TaxID=162209 RepID=A0A0U2U531_9BACL|nr:Xre family transcriptional regulator [Paenibacillus naphthalenovorans]SDI75165.1 DNA-binding transcriptional regulator, XRE-family HTH domain [Paenibacillus naphthalenovorans]